eukprot:2390882-Rhodomonas_salina.3
MERGRDHHVRCSSHTGCRLLIRNQTPETAFSAQTCADKALSCVFGSGLRAGKCNVDSAGLSRAESARIERLRSSAKEGEDEDESEEEGGEGYGFDQGLEDNVVIQHEIRTLGGVTALLITC